MTTRRKQVLAELESKALSGAQVTMAELARRCGLYDYRHARRIVKDLKIMGEMK